MCNAKRVIMTACFSYALWLNSVAKRLQIKVNSMEFICSITLWESNKVYLRLPWIGKISLKFKKQATFTIKECCRAVQPHIIFSTWKILPAVHKHNVHTTHHSTKYGHISKAVPLWTSVRGPNSLNWDCRIVSISKF